jgi:hypothetical protein
MPLRFQVLRLSRAARGCLVADRPAWAKKAQGCHFSRHARLHFFIQKNVAKGRTCAGRLHFKSTI